MNLTKNQIIKAISDLLDIKKGFQYLRNNKVENADIVIDRVIRNLLEVM